MWTTKKILHDPLEAHTPEEFFLTSLENKTLFGLSSSGELTNQLAKQYSVSEDGLEITISLKKAKFSDGVPVTSHDVKATLSRVNKIGDRYAKLLEKIKGSGEAKGSSDFFGISTPDNSTVILSLISPDPFFVYHLAHPATAILPASAIASNGELSFISHSGDYTANVATNELNAVTQYSPQNKRFPIIRVIRKSVEEIKAIPRNDKVDIVLGQTGQSIDFFEKSIPSLAVASWNIYVKDGSSPLSNVKFRQAVFLALDAKKLLEPFRERAVKPSGLVPPTIDSINCKKVCISNTTKSQEIIQELYPQGNIPELSITVEDNEIQKSLAQLVADQLKVINIPTTIHTYEANELSNVIARGEVQLFRYGWVSDVSIGGDLLAQNYKADSVENVTGIVDAKLESVIKSYNKATSSKEKIDDSQAIQLRIQELWLTRPIAQFHKVITLSKKLSFLEFDYYGRVLFDNI